MQWIKLGRIWETPHRTEWMVSHAANPVAEHIEANRYRIYFSCRAANNVSSIAAIEIDLTNPFEILDISESPILVPGSAGLFDDSGVSMGSIVHLGTKRYLYYMGWNLGITVPWRNSIGLAVSEGNSEPFQKYSLTPVLDRNPADPYTISYPWVLHNPETGLWQMWYGSNTKWGNTKSDMDHVINYAESSDGIHWQPVKQGVITFEKSNEFAFAKPCVLKENNLYRMWYAFRGNTYRIGYAESIDGIHWIRKDQQAGIDVSTEGWDSEMICYPNIFEHHGKKYLLYNGNAYGRTGIGLAIDGTQ